MNWQLVNSFPPKYIIKEVVLGVWSQTSSNSSISSIRIPEIGSSANSQTPPQTHRIRNSEGQAHPPVWTSLLKFENHCHSEWILNYQ